MDTNPNGGADRVRAFLAEYAPWQLWLILLVGILLRVTPMLWLRDFWYDEAFTGILLKSSWSEMNRMIIADVHPPLYYWLAKPFAAPFAYSPFGIRLFSIVTGVATIWSLFFVGRKLFSKEAGLLAAFVFAVSPFAVEYADEARMYSLFGLLMLWATWFFFRALADGRTRDWILWGIFGGLSFLTHYLSVFFFVMFYAAFVGHRILFDGRPWRKAVLGERGFYAGVGTIAIFFLGWLKVFIAHVSKGNLGWIDVTYLSTLPSTIQIFLFGHRPGTGGVPTANPFRDFFDGSSAGLVILLLVAVLLTALWTRSARRKEIFLLSTLSLGTPIFLVLLSHVDIRLYVSRYLMPSAVLFILLASFALTGFGRKRTSWLPAAAIFALLVLFLKPIPYDSDWSRVASMRESGAIRAETIVASDPFAYTTARYYFGEDDVRYHHRSNPTEDFSGWVVVGNGNRIETLDGLRELDGAVIVSDTCDWEGLPLSELFRFERLSVCAIPR